MRRTVFAGSILDIPIRMRRPLVATVALGGGPLLKAAGADTAGVERVPQMPAATGPDIMSAWRPVAFRTADARPLRIVGGFLLNIDFRGFDDYRHFR